RLKHELPKALTGEHGRLREQAETLQRCEWRFQGLNKRRATLQRRRERAVCGRSLLPWNNVGWIAKAQSATDGAILDLLQEAEKLTGAPPAKATVDSRMQSVQRGRAELLTRLTIL